MYLYICWSANPGVSMCWSPKENFINDFITACPACFVPLTGMVGMVCMLGSKWPYSYCFVRCCFRDLFKTALRVLDN